jgi:cytochrome c oxidase subunit I+III
MSLGVPSSRHERLKRTWYNLPGLWGFLTAVNHRSVGLRFIVTAFIFLLLGGLQALVMRTQLAQSQLEVVSPDFYNQLMSMHGTTMMFLFAVPLVEGLAIYFMPLMIGARDMAFPKLNAFGYWTYLLAGLTLYVGFFTGQGADGGWFAYPPLTTEFSFGARLDYWSTAVTFLEISALVAAVEIIATVFKMRAPGMALNRIPVFVWSVLVMSFMILFAMPAVLLATLTLALDRLAGTRFYDVALGGDPVLYQHLFWFFGHPEVYLIFLPALGIIATVVPTFARRRLVGYTFVVLSLVSIGVLSFGLWAHHMYTTGLPLLGSSFFTVASVLVGIPSGIQIFCFIATLWQQPVRFTTSFWFALGFFFIFVIGGLTGVMLAIAPFDWQVHDSYFVVAHFHYVLIGGLLFPAFAGLYYWFPKPTGKLLSEKLGKLNFWLMFVGFNVAFFPQHIIGFLGMPRRVYTYLPDQGLDTLNLISTIGAYLFALGIGVTLWNVIQTLGRGRLSGSNPWDAPTLEWATTSPPPLYNFRDIPIVTSRDPLWNTEEPKGEERAARLGEETREQVRIDRRENFGTTLMDALPESRIELPGPSIWPLLSSLSAAVAIIGAMVTLWAVPVGAFLFYITMIGWHWPFPLHRENP